MSVYLLLFLLVAGLLVLSVSLYSSVVRRRRRASERERRRRSRDLERDRRRLAGFGSWSLPPTETASEQQQDDMGQLLSDLDDAVRDDRARDESGELFLLIDRLCDTYLVIDAATRDEIREFFADKPRLQESLLTYSRLSAVRMGNELSEVENVLILRRGIAAASIENLGQEWRDSHVSLSRLYEGARSAGIEPTSYFEEGKVLSSGDNAHPDIEGHPTMKTFLENLMRQLARA